MKILKRTGLVFLALITLLALWIAINSIDDAELSPLAKEMLKPFPEVLPEENGYYDVEYLGKKEFGEVIGVDSEAVRKIYSGQIKADSEAGKMLLERSNFDKLLNDIQKSINKPHFKTPVVHDFVEPLISYQDFVIAWKLILIKSKLAAKNRQINESLDLLNINLLFIEKMQSEENHLLISYMISIYGKSISLLWAHELASEFNLNQTQHKRLLEIINNMKDFGHDGFKNMPRHELAILHGEATERFRHTLSERWVSRDKYIESWLWYMGTMENKKGRAIFDLYEIGRAIIPSYYVHQNKITNSQAAVFFQMEKESDWFCAQISIDQSTTSIYSTKFGYPTLKDILTPNSYARIISESSDDLFNYHDTRCLYHSYVSAIKSVVALHLYKSEHGKLPDSLSELVPDYLGKIPLDYMNGEPIRYSKEKQWLYSVGADYKDDGGSAESIYRGGCHGAFGKNTDEEQDACRMNPTVPINWNDYPAGLR